MKQEFFYWKHKSFCMALNYIQYLLILASVVTECGSISAFASLVGIPIGNAVGLKNFTITAGIKNYQSIIEKAGKNHDKKVFLAKVMLACVPNLPIFLP